MWMLLLLVAAVPALAQRRDYKPIAVPWTHGLPVKPDSSNFVTASYVVASPGEKIYSRLGHATLRLECPSYKLDYCFTFETDVEPGGYLRFFAGQARGRIVAVPTGLFLAPYAREGRQVRQYELNLSLAEKRELWRMLDNDMVSDERRKFNFLANNCVSISFGMVEDCLQGEHIDYVWPRCMSLVNGDYVRYLMRHSPWLSFISITLLGTESDKYWDNHSRVAPELVIDIERHSRIVAPDGRWRPVLTGEQRELLPLRHRLSAPSAATPGVVAACLLLVVLLATVLEWKPGWRRPAQVTDAVLLALQSAAGLLLLYMSTVASLFGTHWNWYIIPFNPVPLVVWLVCRRRRHYGRVYGFYTAVLVLFMLATPLSSQLDWQHQLVVAALAVRTASHAVAYRRRQGAHK